MYQLSTECDGSSMKNGKFGNRSTQNENPFAPPEQDEPCTCATVGAGPSGLGRKAHRVWRRGLLLGISAENWEGGRWGVFWGFVGQGGPVWELVGKPGRVSMGNQQGPLVRLSRFPLVLSGHDGQIGGHGPRGRGKAG